MSGKYVAVRIQRTNQNPEERIFPYGDNGVTYNQARSAAAELAKDTVRAGATKATVFSMTKVAAYEAVNERRVVLR
jgi:hypothetical protein